MRIFPKSIPLIASLTTALFPLFCESANIGASDQSIHLSGIKYASYTDGNLNPQRFRKDILEIPTPQLGLNPDKAGNPSGGIITFSTESPNWTARFKLTNGNYMGTGFGIFENDELVDEFKFTRNVTEIEFSYASRKARLSKFEIALPSYAGVEFIGLELDNGHELEKFRPIKKPVYVALGDSISHGSGQDGFGHKTWPFLLARKLDMELFNLAVGGAKISIPVAGMLEDWQQIDLITILVGYNGLHFNAKSPEQYINDYTALLDTIRRNHPSTKIACISLLYTKKPVSEKTGHSVEGFRKALKKLIAERQTTDSNLIFIPGETISSKKNLRTDNPKDPVHLGIEGAALLAEELYAILSQQELNDRIRTESDPD